MTSIHPRTLTSGRLLSAVALLLMLAMAPASAQESFRATHVARLDGAAERPNPVSTEAVGVAIMRLDTAAKRLEYRISVSNLANVRAAHFHLGRPDTVGPVGHTITLPSSFTTDRTVTGVWEGLTGTEITRLNRGTIYINFHTVAHPEGEIRGEVIRIPNMTATIDTAQVTGSVSSGGIGEARIVVDLAARKLDYLITFSGLSGPATAAHFHRGDSAVDGPLAAPMTLGGREGRAAGTWANISPADLTRLLQRKIYINIHTDAYPNGEIRGQVVPIEYYTAAVSPENEVVKPTNSQSAGTGFLSIVSSNGRTVDVAGEFIVGGTTGPVENAHLHMGPLGVSGPVVRAMQPSDDVTRTLWRLPRVTAADSDSLGVFRAGGIYANFHTAEWSAGELRGQLVPAEFNLLPVASSVSQTRERTTTHTLAASIDPGSGVISIRIAGATTGSSRSIALYSSIGTRVAVVAVEADHARIPSEDLPNGIYFAQLLVDGQPSGICRIPVVR